MNQNPYPHNNAMQDRMFCPCTILLLFYNKKCTLCNLIVIVDFLFSNVNKVVNNKCNDLLLHQCVHFIHSYLYPSYRWACWIHFYLCFNKIFFNHNTKRWNLKRIINFHEFCFKFLYKKIKRIQLFHLHKKYNNQ